MQAPLLLHLRGGPRKCHYAGCMALSMRPNTTKYNHSGLRTPLVPATVHKRWAHQMWFEMFLYWGEEIFLHTADFLSLVFLMNAGSVRRLRCLKTNGSYSECKYNIQCLLYRNNIYKESKNSYWKQSQQRVGIEDKSSQCVAGGETMALSDTWRFVLRNLGYPSMRWALCGKTPGLNK